MRRFHRFRTLGPHCCPASFRRLDNRPAAGRAQPSLFFLAGLAVVAGGDPDIFLYSAHLRRWAAAILARAAADGRFRLLLAAPSLKLQVNIRRSSMMGVLICFFCASNPSIAAVRIAALSLVVIQVKSVTDKCRTPNRFCASKYKHCPATHAYDATVASE